VQRGEVEDPITQPRWAFAVGGLQCLQFRTDQAQDLKRLEKLNQLFFALTVHGETVELGSSPHRHLPVCAALSPSFEGARLPSRVGSEAVCRHGVPRGQLVGQLSVFQRRLSRGRCSAGLRRT
jgi:hypothetical protein